MEIAKEEINNPPFIVIPRLNLGKKLAGGVWAGETSDREAQHG